MIGSNVLCKNWYLLGEKKHFKPRPQNRLLVPLKDFFKISNVHLCPFYMGLVPRPDELGNVISIGRRVVPSSNRATLW